MKKHLIVLAAMLFIGGGCTDVNIEAEANCGDTYTARCFADSNSSLVDERGEQWLLEGEMLRQGATYTVVFDDCGTQSIYDDKIVYLRELYQ